MVEFEFYGGASEFGPNSFSLKNGNKRFLFEYGMLVENMKVPVHKSWDFVKELEGVFLSHAHIDHIGAVPILAKHGYNKPVYGTPCTLDLASMMLWDSLKVQKKNGLNPIFLERDIEHIESLFKPLDLGKPQDVGIKVETKNAGHIPGSSSFLFEADGKRIVFTGDIKFEETQLMSSAHTDFKDIDAVICESTYWDRNHPERKELAKELREKAKTTVDAGGILLLPSFAVGRTQELLLTLSDLGLPIWLDGMGVEITRRSLLHPGSVRDPKKLTKAFAKANKTRRGMDRKQVLKEPGIVISTAGMLSGGPIDFYIKKLWKREDCLMILNGFQVEGTPGKILLDTGKYVNEGFDHKLRMPFEFMDFSAHCGRDGLMNFLKKVNPKKVLPMHSDFAQDFAKDLEKQGFDAFAPKVGKKFEI